MKDIVTADRILKLEPNYVDDFPTHDNSLKCLDPMAPVLEKMGYSCIEIYWRHKQTCYVFERDPWESQLVIRCGKFSNAYQDYCETGNVEDVE